MNGRAILLNSCSIDLRSRSTASTMPVPFSRDNSSLSQQIHNLLQTATRNSRDAQKPIVVPVCKLSVYLQPFHRNSYLKCVLQPKIAKINKTPYFGSSKSFKVIDVDTTKKLITIACCDRQHIHAYLQPFSC